MALYFSTSLSSSMLKDINLLFLFLSLSPPLSLKVQTYPTILGNIKTNGIITSSKYPIRYFELFFVSIDFEIIVLSTSTSQVLTGSYCTIKLFFCYFCYTRSENYYTIKKFCCRYFLAKFYKHFSKNFLKTDEYHKIMHSQCFFQKQVII